MNEEEQRERDQDEKLETGTLEQIMRREANVLSSMGKSLADSAPHLVDKLVNPKAHIGNHYEAMLPSLNFGNFTDDASGIIGSMHAQLLFMFMKGAKQGWLLDDLAYDEVGRWTEEVEESKGRGSERMAKLFFSETAQITLKKEKPKPFKE